jgi:hypothetical protein
MVYFDISEQGSRQRATLGLLRALFGLLRAVFGTSTYRYTGIHGYTTFILFQRHLNY